MGGSRLIGYSCSDSLCAAVPFTPAAAPAGFTGITGAPSSPLLPERDALLLAARSLILSPLPLPVTAALDNQKQKKKTIKVDFSV